MDKRIYIFQVQVYEHGVTTPISEFRAVIISTDKHTAEGDVREAILEDSDGEIGNFTTKLLVDFKENEVGLFDK